MPNENHTGHNESSGKVMEENPKKVAIAVIVNGRETTVDTNVNAVLISVVAKALEQTVNEVQPKENWELRGPSGKIDLKLKVSDLNLPADVKLFLDPKVGITGNG